jgi:hypothetical protein
VHGGEARTPYATVMAAAEEGARAELSREGALAGGGEGRAALVVEVLRVDETSEAIAIAKGARDPLARSIRVTVTGRATLRRGEDVARDTGDMRASEVFAGGGDAVSGEVAREQAAMLAGRRLGERMARRILGYPEPSDP